MKYFLYARKSTDVEEKQVLSIEAQLSELKALARQEQLNIVEVFVEKKSAKMPGRPVFSDILSKDYPCSLAHVSGLVRDSRLVDSLLRIITPPAHM